MPSFKPKGVCASQIDFQLDAAGCVNDLKFTRSCPGNSVGLAKLAEGRPAAELIEMFRGLPCDKKVTSCPDQFAQALEVELDRQKA